MSQISSKAGICFSPWVYPVFLYGIMFITGCLPQTQSLSPDWIVDQGNVLDTEDEYVLTDMLSDFYDSTSVPIVGVTLTSVRGKSLAQYAESLYNSWEIGDPQTHNGIMVLLLVSEQQVDITVGSGMAQELFPQVLDSIRTGMVEYFGAGEYRAGFESGFKALMRHASASSWEIAYVSISEAERDSLRSRNQIISAEGVIIGFEDDLVVLVDSDGREARLIISRSESVLSVTDVVGYTGHIVQTQPMYIQTLNVQVDFSL